MGSLRDPGFPPFTSVVLYWPKGRDASPAGGAPSRQAVVNASGAPAASSGSLSEAAPAASGAQ